MNKKTDIVNLYAGAGAGKSTTAVSVQGLLKMHGVNSEYTAEYAKDRAWEKTLAVKRNDLHMFAEQHQRQFRLDGEVDIIISDSPLLLSSVYRNPPDSLLHALVLQEMKKYHNINFYIKRVKPFNPKGRLGGLKDAEKIDDLVLNMLEYEQIPFKTVNGNNDGVNEITGDILQRLNIKQKYKICKI